MFIVQGTWLPQAQQNQSPHLFLFSTYGTLEIEDLIHGIEATMGDRHRLSLVESKAMITHEQAQEVAGIAVHFHKGSVADSLHLLICLENGATWDQWGMTFGESLQYWRSLAKLILELLASEHFIPSISDQGTVAIWDGLIDDPRIEHRLHRIIAPLSRSLGSDSERIVHHFIAHCIDLFVRETMTDEQYRELMMRMNPRYVAALTPSEHWLQGLFAVEDHAEDPVLEWIAADVRHWREQLLNEQYDTSFRTCFRLAAPNEEEGAARQWSLHIMLQAADDPSLLVPADIVWTEQSDMLHYLNYRFAQHQERLLADLGQASSIFTPLKQVLYEANPAQCMLSTDEAYHFLTVAAEQLSEQGFGVFVPEWWRERPARLGVKLKVSEREQGAHERTGSTVSFHEWLDFEWQLAIGDQPLTAYEFEQLASLKQPLVQVRGQWVELRSEDFAEARRLLQTTGTMKRAEFVQLALLMEEDDGQSPYTHLPIHGYVAEGALRHFMQNLQQQNKIHILQQPAQLLGTLRPYQYKGFSWLVFMRHLQLGVCLADDMGLGKTVQWIAYMLYLKQTGSLTGPALLICPTSIISNWQRELTHFAPSLNIWVHHGSDRLKHNNFVKKAYEVEVVITSYALARRDEEALRSIHWDNITLDEAQHIKNATSKQTQAIRNLSAHHRIALTGTPVENRLAELWSIIDFLNPGYLGTRERFHETFATAIERNEQWEKAHMLQKIVQPFMLRRLKSDRSIIADLPQKDEFTTYCTLTKEQVSLYEACIKHAWDKVEVAQGIARRGTILSLITHLKQICNHPAHYLGEQTLDIRRSGKLQQLVIMLQQALQKDEKVLIFSQYARMAILLRSFLSNYFAQDVLLVHGRIPKQKRDAMIKRFQEDENGPSIFVLSLKTGGFGLNLTKANHVIHYDRWWNPAVEQQATDRAYRIGQQKNVNVHKFVCRGTLEEKIDQMMQSKERLAQRIIGNGDAWLTELSVAELRELITLRGDVVGEQIDGRGEGNEAINE